MENDVNLVQMPSWEIQSLQPFKISQYTPNKYDTGGFENSNKNLMNIILVHVNPV